ncbi:MAG: hypothetical protein GX597_13695 [Anaerolineaceae bacterium]|nr:hypothetical protein [Anaerolineaceae bacterium]
MAATGGHWVKGARGSLNFVPSGGPAKRDQTSAFAAHDADIAEWTRLHGKEMAYIAFGDGTVSELIAGDENSVSIDELREAAKWRTLQDAVLTHTHPMTTWGLPVTLSNNDIAFAAHSKMAEVRAVALTASGRVKIYSMKRGPRGWPDWSIIMSAGNNFLSGLNSQYASGTMSVREWHRAAEAFWQDFAKAWGLTYEERWQ